MPWNAAVSSRLSQPKQYIHATTIRGLYGFTATPPLIRRHLSKKAIGKLPEEDSWHITLVTRLTTVPLYRAKNWRGNLWRLLNNIPGTTIRNHRTEYTLTKTGKCTVHLGVFYMPGWSSQQMQNKVMKSLTDTLHCSQLLPSEPQRIVKILLTRRAGMLTEVHNCLFRTWFIKANSPAQLIKKKAHANTSITLVFEVRVCFWAKMTMHHLYSKCPTGNAYIEKADKTHDP